MTTAGAHMVCHFRSYRVIGLALIGSKNSCSSLGFRVSELADTSKMKAEWKGGAMALLIEFHVPADFQNQRVHWTPPEQRGRVIEMKPPANNTGDKQKQA